MIRLTAVNRPPPGSPAPAGPRFPAMIQLTAVNRPRNQLAAPPRTTSMPAMWGPTPPARQSAARREQSLQARPPRYPTTARRNRFSLLPRPPTRSLPWRGAGPASPPARPLSTRPPRPTSRPGNARSVTTTGTVLGHRPEQPRLLRGLLTLARIARTPSAHVPARDCSTPMLAACSRPRRTDRSAPERPAGGASAQPKSDPSIVISSRRPRSPALSRPPRSPPPRPRAHAFARCSRGSGRSDLSRPSRTRRRVGRHARWPGS
jgi:hypothetical protein